VKAAVPAAFLALCACSDAADVLNGTTAIQLAWNCDVTRAEAKQVKRAILAGRPYSDRELGTCVLMMDAERVLLPPQKWKRGNT
jgi:hypothetical protein